MHHNPAILLHLYSWQREIIPKDRPMSTQSLFEKIYDRMRTKDTAELIAIWKDNDHGLWSNSAFEVIQKILIERGASLPPRGEIKVTVLPSPKFEVPWNFPYTSWIGMSLPWIAFGSLLFWVFLIHPFYFFTRFDGPLWPDIWIRMAAYEASGNIQIFGKLHLILHFIEFGFISYGILMGYFILRRSKKAIVTAKTYLFQFFIFSICLLLFFNVLPYVILYWDVQNSIFDLEPNLNMWMENTHFDSSLRAGSHWGFFLETLKVYWLPISATIFWYVFLIRLKWLMHTFSPESRSAFQ